MDRRDFIGRLLASAVGLAIAPKDLLWRPESGVVGLPPVAPGAVLTLEQITYEMHRLVLDRIGPCELVQGDGSKLRQGQHILGVDMTPPTDVGPEGCLKQYLLPAASALASEIAFRGMRYFDGLPVPPGVWQVERTWSDGFSVRGLMYFDALEGESILRFSVSGWA